MSSSTLSPEAAAAAPAVLWSRRVAVGSLLGLIVLGLAWELVLAPTGNRTLALKVLPLAWPLAGAAEEPHVHLPLGHAAGVVYFAEGVIRAVGDGGLSSVLAMIEVLLCLMLFAACAVHVRWRLSHAVVASNLGESR